MSRPDSAGRLSEEEILELVRDPQFPRGVLLNDRRTLVVSVKSFVSFAQQRFPEKSDIETDLDAFVRERGGKRQKIDTPWGILGDLLRHLARRPAKSGQRGDDVYELPGQLKELRRKGPEQAGDAS